MKVLLDTNVFLWAITDAPRLSTGQRAMLLDERNEFYLSVASIWGMFIKASLGKLPLPIPATEYVAKQMEKNRVGYSRSGSPIWGS